MTKNVKNVLAMAFAAAFLGLTAQYFPDNRMGYALYSVLFVLAIYPVFRSAETVSDKQFIIAALAFVPTNVMLHSLQQYLPNTFIRYSAAALVAMSIVALFTGARKQRHS